MKSGKFQKSRLAAVASAVIMAGLLICLLYPFDLYGNIKSGPARSPLISLKTRIVNAKVIIGKNSVIF